MYKLAIRFPLTLLIIGMLSAPALAQKMTRAQRLAEITELRQQIAEKEKTPGAPLRDLQRQLRELEAVFLSPDADDLAKFAAYTQHWDEGVVRIMPREKFRNLLSLREGGAFYSFANLSHEYAFGVDLSFESGKLTTGFAGANFGFLSELGDVPLDQVSVDSDQVQSLVNYAPPQDEPEARIEQNRFHEKFDHGGLGYVREVSATVGKTYVVRSINYSNSDILAAFRVVRQDVDGSLVLVWKMLRRYPAPRLDRY